MRFFRLTNISSDPFDYFPQNWDKKVAPSVYYVLSANLSPSVRIRETVLEIYTYGVTGTS